MASKKKFYAVVKGRIPGIYSEWTGPGGAQAQIIRFPGAIFKSFATCEEAGEFMKKAHYSAKPASLKAKANGLGRELSGNSQKESGIVIYTDGGCLDNPGPGGYGVVIIDGEKRIELSGGFRLTTNNRMELMACIVALQKLVSSVTEFCKADIKS